MHQNCPNPKKQLKLAVQTAAAANFADENDDTEPDEEQEEVDAINSVSIAFPNFLTNGTKSTELLSLFDTGSPVSFIRQAHLPFKVTGIHCRIHFKNRAKNVKLTILPNDAMRVRLILGRDFLLKFNIILSQSKLVY